jgi:ADP-ribose pyrophosphatase YjhB (NUDIX family)
MDQTAQHGSTKPEPQPVVVAIVTSEHGVLLGRRNDGKPPWTFIAGEIEPGESPADAGVREVKEETGLLVAAGEEIGRRAHPATGRTMIYMAHAQRTAPTSSSATGTSSLKSAGSPSPRHSCSSSGVARTGLAITRRGR